MTKPEEVSTPNIATPEEAVTLFVDSVAANDLKRALRAYAAHEPAARFDFISQMRNTRSLNPDIQKAPAEYPIFVEMNQLRAKAHMAAATKAFVYDLLADTNPREARPVKSAAEVEAFVQAVDPARLATLRIVRIDRARRLLTDGGEAQAMFEGDATREGADEVTERIALYELSGQFFWSGFRLSRYGQDWKISQFAAVYGGPFGAGVARTTPAEYEAQVSNEPVRREIAARDVQPQAARPVLRDTSQACAQSFAESSLSTPEAAINRYVASVAASSLACAFDAFAAREHATRFDFTSTATWVGVLNPKVLKAPAKYPLFVEINEHRARGEMADASKLFVYGLLIDRDPRDFVLLDSDAEIRALLQAVNPSRLAALKVVRIDQPKQSQINGPRARKLFTDFAAREGADEMTERIALYGFSGQLFWSGFTLCRYGETWKIYDFKSTWGGPPGDTVLAKTTASEYEARLQ